MLNNLKTNFTNLWRYVAGGGTILAYEALYDRIKNQNTVKDQLNEVNTIKDNVIEVKKILINQNNINEATRTKLFEKIEPLIECIKEIELLQNTAKNDLQNTEYYGDNIQNVANDAIKSTLENYHQEMGNLINKSLQGIADLEKFLEENGISKKLFEDSFISNLITEFKEYLTTLSIHELCILIDFLLITIVLSCLISILFAFYGNFFIEKLSLETKYPKLSGIIKLRVKFQH